jgi:hypothetical protein
MYTLTQYSLKLHFNIISRLHELELIISYYSIYTNDITPHFLLKYLWT